MAILRGIRVLQMRNLSNWTPANLFANGETGFWLDAKDSSTMAQNSDGSGSVSNGNPVGRWRSKAGQTYDFIQGTSGQRPTWSSTNGMTFVAASSHFLRASGLTPYAYHGFIAATFNTTGVAAGGNDGRILSCKSGSAEDFAADKNFTINMRTYSQSLDFYSTITTWGTGTVLSYNSWNWVDGNATSDVPANDIAVRLNDTTDGTVNSGRFPQSAAAPTWDRLTIGSRDSGVEVFDGYIGDIVMRKERLTSTELSLFRSYIRTKYGVA